MSPADRDTTPSADDGPDTPTIATSPERTQRERPYVGRPFILGTIHPSTHEIRELAQTLGLELVLEVYQPRTRPHPGAFFGKGRLAALRKSLDEWRAGIHPDDWVRRADHWIVSNTSTEGADDDAGTGTAWGGTAWAQAHHGRPKDHEAGGTDRAGAHEKDGADRAGAHETGPGRGRADDKGHAIATENRLPHWRDDVIMILDEDVRPAVLFNLEERLGVEVWDRTRLILEIFSQHAHVKEAKLQVELAKLQYEIPLIHEAVHRRRSGERPGFRGGGEYGVADYEDFIKRRMRTVKDELEHIRLERDVRRKVRRERFYLVSLAGYTNAGKSSLLNALTGAGTLSANTLFSTLATTTRRMHGGERPGPGGTPWQRVETEEGDGLGAERPTRPEPHAHPERQAGPEDHTRPEHQAGSEGHARPGGPADPERQDAASTSSTHQTPAPAGVSGHERPVLLTDTVGFIQALPSWLLDAFHSTLEEIAVSDVVLLVADVSDPVEVLVDKVRVCRSELAFLDVTCPVVLVLNKSDLVPERAIRAKAARLQAELLARPDHTVVVSSLTGFGVPDLATRIHEALPAMIPFEASVPSGGQGQRLVSRIYEWGAVSHIDYGHRVELRGACDPLHWKSLLKEGTACGARISRRSV